MRKSAQSSAAKRRANKRKSKGSSSQTTLDVVKYLSVAAVIKDLILQEAEKKVYLYVSSLLEHPVLSVLPEEFIFRAVRELTAEGKLSLTPYMCYKHISAA